MKAIVYHDYGSPDVLQLEEIEKPVAADNEVLIKVRAASINPLDWHFMRGTPYIVRIVMTGLSKPKNPRLGVDVAGHVEAVGSKVTQFKAGDEVFGTCRGAFAEYVCTSASNLVIKPTNVRASGCCTHSGIYRIAGPSRQGKDSAGTQGLGQRRIGRHRHIRRADRQVIRRRDNRRMQHEERRHGPIHRRRSGHRLHPGRLHQKRTTLRPDLRRRRKPLIVSTQASLIPKRNLRHGRRTKRSLANGFG
jgi:hypothetical protein